MNNFRIFLVFILILFVSCSKNSKNPENRSKFYQVSFDVSGFDIEIKPIDKMTSNVKTSSVQTTPQTVAVTPVVVGQAPGSVVNHIYCHFYDNQGYVKQIHQVRGDPGFGKITDSVPAGDYTIVFLASVDSLKIDKILKRLNFEAPGTDVFYNRINLSVGGVINKPITLARKVGLLQVNITDQIPFWAKKITVRIVNTNLAQIQTSMSLTDGSFGVPYYPIVTKNVEGDEFYRPVTFYIYLSDVEFFTYTYSIYLNVYDSTGERLAYFQLIKVPVSMDTKTILTGTLFDKNNSGTGLDIAIPNPAWQFADIKRNF